MLSNRYKKSKPALMLLNIVAVSLSLIGSGVIVTGCFLTLHHTFRDLPGLMKKVDLEFDYSHYWVGGMYLVSAAMAFCSACCQSKRRLTFVTALFLLISMALSMFAIVLDGPEWVEWKNNGRRLTYWENNNGYTCASNNNTCICNQGNSTAYILLVSDIVDCDKVELLTIMYGIMVGGYVVGQVICFGALFVMINSFSWKNPWKSYTSYTTSYLNKGTFSAVDDVIELYKDRNRYQTMASASSSASSMPRVNYPPAWSLYSNGVAAQEQESVQY